MNNIINTINLGNISTNIYILKTFFISLCAYFTFLKIINYKSIFSKNFIIIIIFSFIISIMCGVIKYFTDSFTSIMFSIFLLSILYSKIINTILGNTLLITTISLSINYVIFVIAIIVAFIANLLLHIKSDYINLLIMVIVHSILITLLFKIKRFKNGFSFLKKNFNNEHFDILILDISVTIFFTFIILNNFEHFLTLSLFLGLIIFSIIMFITIQKTLTMYYKHKLLVNELEEAKLEIEKKDKEIADLETENLNFSKMSHSVAYKQKSLEYKLNELMLKSEISSELDISDRLNKISNSFLKPITTVELSKTNVEQLDDMFTYMQSECVKNNIDFELQLSGNIHHMTNNFINKDDLEVLIADHIKNAIIAINHSDNVNRSILVRLGMFERYYSLYIYDSGIEFEIDTLLNLGEKPSTTHKDEGGTGIGFMNTFDTLKKYEASILINESNPSCKENYTKSIVIKFDKKNEYRICSYRSEKIKTNNHRENLIIRKFV